MKYTITGNENNGIDKVVYECNIGEALIIDYLISDAYRNETMPPQDMKIIEQMKTTMAKELERLAKEGREEE